MARPPRTAPRAEPSAPLAAAAAGEAAFQFTVQLQDRAHLEQMAVQVLSLPGVTRVLRCSLRELKLKRSAAAFWALAEPGAAFAPACDAYDAEGLAAAQAVSEHGQQAYAR